MYLSVSRLLDPCQTEMVKNALSETFWSHRGTWETLTHFSLGSFFFPTQMRGYHHDKNVRHCVETYGALYELRWCSGAVCWFSSVDILVSNINRQLYLLLQVDCTRLKLGAYGAIVIKEIFLKEPTNGITSDAGLYGEVLQIVVFFHGAHISFLH